MLISFFFVFLRARTFNNVVIKPPTKRGMFISNLRSFNGDVLKPKKKNLIENAKKRSSGENGSTPRQKKTWADEDEKEDEKESVKGETI